MTWHPSFARNCGFCGGLRRAGHDEQCAREKFDWWGDRLDTPVVVKPPGIVDCVLCGEPLEASTICRCELTFAGADTWQREDW